jgi:hypothetical protein
MIRTLSVVLSVVLCSACGSSPLTAPTTIIQPPAVRELAYAINIPLLLDLQRLKLQYPDGIHIAPLAAQGRWDYSVWYGGTPNVYAGPIAPRCQNFFNTGIVVAPRAVAGMDTFTALDWPGIGLDAGVTYAWTGRFTFAAVASPSAYVSDARCL